MSTQCLFTLCLIFKASLFIQVSHQGRLFFFIQRTLNQADATSYCRDHYTDLAAFDSSDELAGNLCTTACWIGFQRLADLSPIWVWSDGETSSVTNWQIGEPNNVHLIENCAIMNSNLWYDIPCTFNFSLLCYMEEPILVQQNKTWEEALETCRSLPHYPNYVKPAFDLYKIRSEYFISSTKRVIVAAQTQEVWIGLRYLTGKWLWLNGNPLAMQLPVCPTAGNYCGTITKQGEIKLNNCSERRNFFCSRN